MGKLHRRDSQARGGDWGRYRPGPRRRRRCWLGFALGLGLGALSGCESARFVAPPGPRQHGELIHIALDDPYESQQPTLAAGGTAAAPGYFAYLPAGTTDPLPVLYLLPDMGQDESAFPYFVMLPTLLDEMIESKAMQPHLVIMPNGLSDMGGSFFTDSMLPGESDPLESTAFGAWGMQLLQIMEDAEGRFDVATSGFTVAGALAGEVEPGNRALGGIGMGAYGAFMTALRAPVFDELILHSGFFDLRGGLLTPDPFMGQRWGELLLEENQTFLGQNHLGPSSPALRNNPDAPISRLLFAMAAAFSPARGPLCSFDMAAQIDSTLTAADPDGDPLNNYQYPLQLLERGATPAEDIWLGAWLPVQADGGIVDAVLLRWTLFHDPLYLATSGQPEISALAARGVRLWIDVGASDEFGLADDNERFAAALNPLFNDLSFTVFGGAHSDRLLDRLALSLAWLE